MFSFRDVEFLLAPDVEDVCLSSLSSAVEIVDYSWL